MKTFAIAAIVASVSAIDATKFAQWAVQHGRMYQSADDFHMRLANFMATDAAIQVLNEMNSDATFDHNEFSDYTEEERKQMRGKVESIRNEEIEYRWLPEANNPQPVDWRDNGSVTGVKNQKSCGSCWSFSSTGAMEGAHHIKTKKLLSLSEQQFVDCDSGNYGCDGGNQDDAFKYAQRNPIALESDYSYTGKDGRCQASHYKGHVSVSGYKYVPNNSVSQLKAAVARQPIAVSIDASGSTFNNYKSGVITSGCHTRIDHAVLLVGWDKTKSGQEYWIVKNSWGRSWGENGYVRIAIEDGQGVCGIQKDDNCYPSTD